MGESDMVRGWTRGGGVVSDRVAVASRGCPSYSCQGTNSKVILEFLFPGLFSGVDSVEMEQWGQGEWGTSRA
jgi:hypothetical protein